MGVSGSGKSRVGTGVAEHLGVRFVDGDDLHPPANVEKVSAGIPLDDDDRHPWLDAVGEWLSRNDDVGGVVACSALRRRYRDQLRAHSPRVVFVHLHGSRRLIERRQANRRGHFMPASLLDSQFAALQPLTGGEPGIVIDVDQSVGRIIRAVLDYSADHFGSP